MSRIDRLLPVPLPTEQLRIGLVLPFTLLDAEGRVLLAKGQRIEDEQQLRRQRAAAGLCAVRGVGAGGQGLHDGAAGAFDRRGGAIKDLDRYVQLSDDGVAKEAESLHGTLPDRCRGGRGCAGCWPQNEMGGVAPADSPARFEQLWRDIGSSPPTRRWRRRARWCDLHRLHQPGRVQRVLHALQCAVLARQVAPLLKLSAEESRTLVLATASMNVAMLRLQDALAQQRVAPSPVQRAQIDAHAAEGERLLRAAGVADPLWLEAVRLHHTPLVPGVALAQRPPAQRLAHIVQVLDRYTAAMSPRASRPGRTAKDAARIAGDSGARTGGAQDEVGLALVQLLGLYPPGTFVRLTGARRRWCCAAARGRHACRRRGGQPRGRAAGGPQAGQYRAPGICPVRCGAGVVGARAHQSGRDGQAAGLCAHTRLGVALTVYLSPWTARPMVPQSVLVVVHTSALDVLLLERTDAPGFWQSVTGAKDTPEEPWEQTAVREVAEETGIDARAVGCALIDWGLENVYAIYRRWRHRMYRG